MIRHRFRNFASPAVIAVLVVCCMIANRSHADDDSRLTAMIEHVSSRRTYEVGTVADGEKSYVDRQYAYRKVPDDFIGKIALRTSNEDDYIRTTDHLKLQLSHPATVYVGLDARGSRSPDWMKDWKLTEDSLETTEVRYRLYRRDFRAGQVVLGGNDRTATGCSSNYVVIIVPVDRKPTTDIPPFPVGDFAVRVLPLLQKHCFDCHGVERQEGGLRLDVRRRALLGGDTAKAIQPGSSAESELIVRIESVDEKLRMPQGDIPLSGDEISLLRHWIDAGAVWPDELAGSTNDASHWSFQPIIQPAIPPVRDSDWVKTPVDAFILSRLEQAGLTPSAEADRPTLIRRLSLDLLGLPPETEDVAAFIADERPDAYARLVDRLLESPHFGERWGKHWLDQARFAESDGYENDKPRPFAWHYRNWVIQAINQDLPFDQFTIQQLAGDLLDQGQPDPRIAAAFHRNTLYNSAGGADAEEFRSKAVKDRTAVTGAIWLGLTLNCAECHSHKYDPISHREYYRLYAFFNNSDDDQVGDIPTLKPLERITRIHRRGNFLDPGFEVEPGVPAFLPELQSRGGKPDRLDLAHWLTSPEHPLTSRVAVNHLWQHLFGSGLVPTPENFGRRGESPTHPELLDWLAAEFIGQRGTTSGARPWSRKSLIRLLVLSATYRQSSILPESIPTADPDNRLLWRQNRFRLEAEVVRDLALAASGLLQRDLGGPSIQPPLPKSLSQLSELKNERFQESSGSPYRRGVYVHMQRTFPYPMFATFDAPDGNFCTMVRDRSTTPLQALTLLNDPAMDDCARTFGRRLMDVTQDEIGRIEYGFQLCLARTPDPAEIGVLRHLVAQQRDSGTAEEVTWTGVARTLLNLDETITRE